MQADGGRIKQKKVEVGEEGVLYEFTVRAQELTALIPRDYTGELFEGGASAGSNREVVDGSGTKRGKKWYRVMSVGIDTVSAARERDGRVVTIQIVDETRAKTEAGEEQAISAFLASLREGQTIKVQGKAGKGKRTIIAKRLRGWQG